MLSTLKLKWRTVDVGVVIGSKNYLEMSTWMKNVVYESVGCLLIRCVYGNSQGASHRLEIHTPNDTQMTSDQPLHVNDLDTEDEDKVTLKMKQYEETIGSLMTDLGTLKSEVSCPGRWREISSGLSYISYFIFAFLRIMNGRA